MPSKRIAIVAQPANLSCTPRQRYALSDHSVRCLAGMGLPAGHTAITPCMQAHSQAPMISFAPVPQEVRSPSRNYSTAEMRRVHVSPAVFLIPDLGFRAPSAGKSCAKAG